MGPSQSKQCNPGIFGTGPGVPVNYNGTTQNLGGASTCNTYLAECMNQCESVGCGSSGTQAGDCCKMCESACCQPGPAYNPKSPICAQIANSDPPLPEDYCNNRASRLQYDYECPTGCLEGANANVSASGSIGRVNIKNAHINFLTSPKVTLLIILILILLGYLILRQHRR